MLGFFINETPVVPIPTVLGPLGSSETRELSTVSTIQTLQNIFVGQYTEEWERHRGYPTYNMVTPILSGTSFGMSFITPESVPPDLRNNPAITVTGSSMMSKARAIRNAARRPLNSNYDKIFLAQRYNPVNLFTRGDGAGVKVPLTTPLMNPAKEIARRVRWMEKPEDLRASVRPAQSPQNREVPELIGRRRSIR